MNGITVEQHNNSYRVLRWFPGGTVCKIAEFTAAADAIAYATDRVLELDNEENES